MAGAKRIHFNLEGMDMERFFKYFDAGLTGYSNNNATSWELSQILRNEDLWRKTWFYGIPK
jgi:hypothetical protein